jgi:ABC-type uncharacterized transport system YnjBCD permease subunit
MPIFPFPASSTNFWYKEIGKLMLNVCLGSSVLALIMLKLLNKIKLRYSPTKKQNHIQYNFLVVCILTDEKKIEALQWGSTIRGN